MTTIRPATAPALSGAVVAALITVYLFWGSTYLAIAVAVAGIPPLASSGVRYVTAGVALLLGLRLCGTPWPPARAWLGSLVVGILMLVIGNGLVCVAELHVPSGLTALLLAITPIFVVAGTWALGGQRPTRLAVLGMALGLIGVAVLCSPHDEKEGIIKSLAAPWWGYASLFIASFSWAMGLVVGPRLFQAEGVMMRTAIQMLSGGVILLVIATLTGERLPSWSAAPASWLAVLYLAIFGSVLTHTCYLWLQRHASPALATSNAYVNPLVALVLGTTLHGEGLNGRIGLGAPLVIGAVVVIALGNRKT